MNTRPSRAMRLAVSLISGTALFLFAPGAAAHPGNTDSRGGHTCRTNCPSWGLSYGQYHYHSGSRSSLSRSRDALPLLPPAPKQDNTWKWVLGIGAGLGGLYWLGRQDGPKK